MEKDQLRVIVIGAFILILLVSCGKQMYYSYKSTMTPATVADSLVYENDSMRIKFFLDAKAISFKIDNKLNDAMLIKWDEGSMSINGKSYRIVHKETGAYRIRDIQPSTTIPPHSYLKDQYIPSDKISYLNTSGGPTVIVSPTFPDYNFGNKSTDRLVKSLEGAVVIIYLPVYISGQYAAKSFQININDILKSNHRFPIGKY